MLGLPAESCKEMFFFFHKTNPFIVQACVVKMVGYLPHSKFCPLMDAGFISVSQHAKKKKKKNRTWLISSYS